MDEEEIYQLFMEEIKKYPVLSKKETNKLLYEYQVEHNQESYEKLLLHNLGLVVIMARKYVGKSKTMGLLDFIQENYLIMRKAIASFDVNKGYQLSTYICDSMGYSLQLKIDQKDATIKLPVKLKQGERKYVKYIYDYYKETGKRPDKKQIEHFAKIDLKQQKKIENIQLYNTISLNIEESKEEIFEERMNDLEYPKNNIIEWENNQDTFILLRSIYDCLKKREYFILYHQAVDYRTQKELGEILEISSERVRQIYADATRKIRKIGLINLRESAKKKYKITNIDKRELIPIDPKLRASLSYLRDVMDSIPYHIIYTKFCDRKNDNFAYYQTCFPEEFSYNIEEQMKNTSAFMNRFLIPENIDQIYRMVRNTLPVREILELDIKPENAFLRDFFTLCPEHNAHLENAFKSAWKEESSKTPYIKKIPSVNKEG